MNKDDIDWLEFAMTIALALAFIGVLVWLTMK